MIRDEETPPNPAFERVLDMMFILHAEHEQNCSTAVMRCVGSALADPYLCTAAAASALSGPLHGGANLEVLRMLGGVGAKERVHDYLVRVKAGQAPLSGFGHQVYEIYDPRARIVRRLAEQISESTKRDTLLDVALEFERIAMEDEFFLSKNLYPTIELYSGILFRSLGFPIKALPLLFAIARTSGWLAHWSEMLDSPKRGMVRPRQIYNGPPDRELLSKIE
jgi:citrate synthase